MEKLKTKIKNQLSELKNKDPLEISFNDRINNSFILNVYLDSLPLNERKDALTEFVDNNVFLNFSKDEYYLFRQSLTQDEKSFLNNNIQKFDYLKDCLNLFAANEVETLEALLENKNNVLLNNIENPWILSFIKNVYDSSNEQYQENFRKIFFNNLHSFGNLEFFENNLLLKALHIDLNNQKDLFYFYDKFIHNCISFNKYRKEDFIKILEKTKFYENNEFINFLSSNYNNSSLSLKANYFAQSYVNHSLEESSNFVNKYSKKKKFGFKSFFKTVLNPTFIKEQKFISFIFMMTTIGAASFLSLPLSFIKSGIFFSSLQTLVTSFITTISFINLMDKKYVIKRYNDFFENKKNGLPFKNEIAQNISKLSLQNNIKLLDIRNELSIDRIKEKKKEITNIDLKIDLILKKQKEEISTSKKNNDFSKFISFLDDYPKAKEEINNIKALVETNHKTLNFKSFEDLLNASKEILNMDLKNNDINDIDNHLSTIIKNYRENIKSELVDEIDKNKSKLEILAKTSSKIK